MPRGSKPGERRGGRQKGTPNKATKLLKDHILGALEAQEGGSQAYLARQAKENPKAFLSLLGRVLPVQVTGDGGGPVQVEMTATEKAARLAGLLALAAARREREAGDA